MSAQKQDISEWLIIVIMIALCSGIIGFFAWFELVKTSTSNWWKTEIVRRGYGTWEATTDGQVWFKWKENNPYNHEK